MASIIKRKKNYSIVYTYVDENGETKQKWETRTSYQEALKRKAEIESQKSSNSFLPPTNQNIAEFLSDFVSLYGEKRWGVSMYDSQNSLIANYINPIPAGLVLTGIVVSVSVSALMLSLTVRIYKKYHTLDMDALYLMMSNRRKGGRI